MILLLCANIQNFINKTELIIFFKIKIHIFASTIGNKSSYHIVFSKNSYYNITNGKNTFTI